MLYRMREVIELFHKHGMVDAARISYGLREQEIAKAWRWPNRLITVVFGLTYFLALLIAAAFVRPPKLSDRTRNILRELASRYYYIPEIVCFKGLELEAACKHPIYGRVLDLGCGTGLTGASIKQNSDIDELVGLDRVRTLVARDAYASYCLGDGGALPFAPGTFDFVLTLGVLDHIPHIDETLKECARVLKPNGGLVFAIQTIKFRESTFWYRVFRKFFPRSELAGNFQTYRDVYDMIFHYRTEDEWRTKLASAGFSRIEVDYIFPADNLFYYDLMNIQTYFLRFFFADRAKYFLDRHSVLRQQIVRATYKVSSRLMNMPVSRDNATRYFIRAYT